MESLIFLLGVGSFIIPPHTTGGYQNPHALVAFFAQEICKSIPQRGAPENVNIYLLAFAIEMATLWFL